MVFKLPLIRNEDSAETKDYLFYFIIYITETCGKLEFNLDSKYFWDTK